MGFAEAAMQPFSQDDNTFVNFRYRIRSGYHALFWTKEVQHNSFRFVYYDRAMVSDLRDQRHNKTLREQNAAIRNAANISSTAGLTVFASGQGGNYTQGGGALCVEIIER